MSHRPCAAKGDSWSCRREWEKGGFCAFHYRQHRNGATLTPEPLSVRECAYEGCTRGHSAKGYCSAHYNQKFVLGYTDLTPIGTYSRGDTARVRDESGFKNCSSCNQWKPESSFSKRSKAPDGLTARCAECGRRAALWKSYKLTPEAIFDMVETQGGCAICGIENPPSQWHVDHDHSCCTGWKTCGECVRGVLCNNCNLGIGMLGDSPEVLDRASEYLKKWKSTSSLREETTPDAEIEGILKYDNRR